MAYVDEEKANSAYLEHTPTHEEQQRPKMDIKGYMRSRIPTLKPTMTKPPNPFKLLGLLNRKHWNFFSVSVPCDSKAAYDDKLMLERRLLWLPGLGMHS
jgi:hypothetical protein